MEINPIGRNKVKLAKNKILTEEILYSNLTKSLGK